MLNKKTNFFNPRYKNFYLLKNNINNNEKILKFKKEKWKKLIFNYKKKLKKYNKFKPQSQIKYFVTKYPNKIKSYKKQHKNILDANKALRLYCGNWRKYYVKSQLKMLTYSNYSRIHLFKILDRRLDIILYKSKFYKSVKSARQDITHGKIFINKIKIKSPSYKLKNNETISINRSSFFLIEQTLKKSVFWPIPPKHLLLNFKTLEIHFENLTKKKYSNDFFFFFDSEKIINDYYYK